jgi:hypothetical protein
VFSGLPAALKASLANTQESTLWAAKHNAILSLPFTTPNALRNSAVSCPAFNVNDPSLRSSPYIHLLPVSKGENEEFQRAFLP